MDYNVGKLLNIDMKMFVNWLRGIANGEGRLLISSCHRYQPSSAHAKGWSTKTDECA